MTEDPRWFEWSSTTLGEIADSSRLVINPIIFAEVSIRYSTIEDLLCTETTSMVLNPLSRL